jgi:hypothetical protein
MSSSYVGSPGRSRWGLTLLVLGVLVLEAGLGARALAEVVHQALLAQPTAQSQVVAWR